MQTEEIHHKIAQDLYRATHPEADVHMIKRILSFNFSPLQKKKFDSVIEAYYEEYNSEWMDDLSKQLGMQEFLEIHNLISFKEYYSSIKNSPGVSGNLKK